MRVRMDLKRRHNRGDPCECPECTGKLTVQSTIVNEDEGLRTMYIYCNVCLWAPDDNKLVIPLEFSPPRRAS